MNRSAAKLFSLCLLGAVVLLIPTDADAQRYVRTQTCNITGSINPCEPGETPIPIKWDRSCVTYYLNEVGTPDLPGPNEGEIAPRLIDASRAGFEAWNEPESSRFTYEYGGLTNEDRAEWVPDRGRSGNANIVVWREDWPDDFSQTAFAITSVNYNPETAVILDADIELNSEFHDFTVDEDNPVVDVQNTIAHESGHFLGLDHTSVRLATMFGSAPLGQTIKRTLEETDINGVTEIYPADGTADTCADSDGFFEKPTDEDDGCCTTVKGDVHSNRPLFLALMLVGLLGLRRQR